MLLDTTQLAQAALDVKRDVLADIAGDTAAPAHTASVTRILLEKPWVPDFLMPLISPLRSTLRAMLKMSVMRVDNRVWYFPSFHWWRGHARLLHGEDGSDCNVSKHVLTLTDASQESLFLMADLMKDGTLKILGEEDYKIEAAQWPAYFKGDER
jgi:hypothetical protein